MSKENFQTNNKNGFRLLFLTTFAIGARAIASGYLNFLKNRAELTSTIYSFEYLKDGIRILNDGFDPYQSNDFNFTPIILHSFSFLFKFFEAQSLLSIFIVIDVATAWILSRAARECWRRRGEKEEDAVDLLVFCLYAFNPIAILSAGILSITVLRNFLIALVFWAYVKESSKICAALIGFWSSFTIYPVVFLFSLAFISKNCAYRFVLLLTIAIFAFSTTNFINFWLNGKSWSWIENCYWVILNFENIQPNVSLYWYFSVQIFEHFHSFYCNAFNILIFFIPFPISLLIRKDAALNFTMNLLIASIFFPYPTLNQATVILSILPLQKGYSKFLRYSLPIASTFVASIALMPVMWHMWIVSSSGNANFFFAATIFYNISLIHLFIDLLFGYSRTRVEKEYGDAVKNGVFFQLNVC